MWLHSLNVDGEEGLAMSGEESRLRAGHQGASPVRPRPRLRQAPTQAQHCSSSFTMQSSNLNLNNVFTICSAITVHTSQFFCDMKRLSEGTNGFNNAKEIFLNYTNSVIVISSK